MKSVRLEAIMSSDREYNRVGVFVGNNRLFLTKISETPIAQNPISIEVPVAPVRFGNNDTIGVFLDRSFCEGSATITSPKITIQYASV